MIVEFFNLITKRLFCTKVSAPFNLRLFESGRFTREAKKCSTDVTFVGCILLFFLLLFSYIVIIIIFYCLLNSKRPRVFIYIYRKHKNILTLLQNLCKINPTSSYVCQINGGGALIYFVIFPTRRSLFPPCFINFLQSNRLRNCEIL